MKDNNKQINYVSLHHSLILICMSIILLEEIKILIVVIKLYEVKYFSNNYNNIFSTFPFKEEKHLLPVFCLSVSKVT